MGFLNFFTGGSEASDNFEEAKRTNELADFIVEDAQNDFLVAKDSCEESLKKLDNRKQELFKGPLSRFVNNFSKIKKVDFTVPQGLYELEKYTESHEDDYYLYYPSLTRNTTIWESSFVKNVVTGGVAAASGLVGLGLTATILRPYIKKKSRIALDEANANYAEAELAAEQYEAASELCSYIEARSEMFISVLDKLNELFVPLVSVMSVTIRKKGTDYSCYSLQERKNLASAVSLASSIKSVLDVAILNSDGELTQESKQLCIDMAEQLELPCDPSSLGDEDSQEESFGYLSEQESLDPIEQRIKDIIVERLGVVESEVTRYASFSEDLGADSVDAVELIMDFEKEFGITISEEDAEYISTVGDAYDYIKSNIKYFRTSY